jgi:hypothetical protein
MVSVTASARSLPRTPLTRVAPSAQLRAPPSLSTRSSNTPQTPRALPLRRSGRRQICPHTCTVRDVLIHHNAAAVTEPAPSPSPSGGIVTVCPGTTVDLDSSNGTPLPLDVQQRMITVMSWRCTHPDAPARGMFTPGSNANFVSPMGTTFPIGYVAAHLSISPGSLSYHTTASSMSYGPSKTLDCVIQFNGGPGENCGSASGTGTSLSTRTNLECPAPGQHVEVTAWLLLGGSEYYDSAYGVTQ